MGARAGARLPLRDPMQQPLVSVITPNLNGRHHLEIFLDSLLQQEFPRDEIEVIVVDNGSSDGSVELLEERFPHVVVIRNDHNTGFAKANNQGAKRARGRYLAFLNNDVRLERSWLATMVGAIESTPADVVCIASKILSWDGRSIDFIDAGMAFNGRAFQPHFGLPTDAEEATPPAHELLFSCGAAMMIDRDVYLDVGGFDDDYFAYFEDVDLGWRLWVFGYRVVLCPEAVVYHRHNASRPIRPKQVFLFERNALFSIVKNYDDESLSIALPAALLLAFKRASGASGVPRSTFAPRARVAPQPSTPPLRAPVPLRRHVYLALRRRLLLLLGRDSFGRRASDPGAATFPVTGEAQATVAGLAEAFEMLGGFLEKRAAIQARRRRPDSEILALFRDPFMLGPLFDDGGFAALEALGVVDYFRPLAAPVGDEVAARSAPPAS